MGQLDNVSQQPAAGTKLDLGGIQFHDVHGSQPALAPGGGQHIDFHSIVSGMGADKIPPVAAPAQIVPPHPAQLIQPSQTVSDRQAAPAPYQQPKPSALMADSNPPRPPHPEDSDSTGDKVGSLFSTLIAGGAGIAAGKSLQRSVRNDEIARTTKLAEVTKPETLEALKNQTDEVTRLVATKAKAAAGDVEKLAAAKPEAFQEITELMPAKGPGRPPEQLVYHQPKPARSMTQDEMALPEDQRAALQSNLTLTEDELAVTDRAEYLRSLEKVVVKDFNMGNTATVSAYRTRQPYIKGLGDSEAAGIEGLKVPLNKLESLSDSLMEQTTIGRLSLHKAASGEIYTGIGVLAGSFVATRGIDHLIYGGKSQGMLTTGFDCALPFLVLTKMSPLAKVGLMIGVHEAVRGIEYFTAKNKDN